MDTTTKKLDHKYKYIHKQKQKQKAKLNQTSLKDIFVVDFDQQMDAEQFFCTS